MDKRYYALSATRFNTKFNMRSDNLEALKKRLTKVPPDVVERLGGIAIYDRYPFSKERSRIGTYDHNGFHMYYENDS